MRTSLEAPTSSKETLGTVLRQYAIPIVEHFHKEVDVKTAAGDMHFPVLVSFVHRFNLVKSALSMPGDDIRMMLAEMRALRMIEDCPTPDVNKERKYAAKIVMDRPNLEAFILAGTAVKFLLGENRYVPRQVDWKNVYKVIQENLGDLDLAHKLNPPKNIFQKEGDPEISQNGPLPTTPNNVKAKPVRVEGSVHKTYWDKLHSEVRRRVPNLTEEELGQLEGIDPFDLLVIRIVTNPSVNNIAGYSATREAVRFCAAVLRDRLEPFDQEVAESVSGFQYRRDLESTRSWFEAIQEHPEKKIPVKDLKDLFLYLARQVNINYARTRSLKVKNWVQ